MEASSYVNIWIAYRLRKVKQLYRNDDFLLHRRRLGWVGHRAKGFQYYYYSVLKENG